MDVPTTLLFSSAALAAAGTIVMVKRHHARFFPEVLLSRFDLSQWRHRNYAGLLPNFLEGLYTRNVTTPWPIARNKIATVLFYFRTRSVLKSTPVQIRRQFHNCHIHLYSLLHMIKPFINDAIHGELQKIASSRVADMLDSLDRERLLQGLKRIAEIRTAFQNGLTAFDRALQEQLLERQIFRQLKSLHAIFSEHGYTLIPGLDEIHRWESLTGPEIARKIPALLDFSPHSTGLRPSHRQLHPNLAT